MALNTALQEDGALKNVSETCGSNSKHGQTIFLIRMWTNLCRYPKNHGPFVGLKFLNFFCLSVPRFPGDVQQNLRELFQRVRDVFFGWLGNLCNDGPWHGAINMEH